MELTRAQRLLRVNEKSKKDSYIVYNKDDWVSIASYLPSSNQNEKTLVTILKPLLSKLSGQGIFNLNLTRLKG